MRSIRFHCTGGPNVLQCDNVPVPQPGPGEALVRIEAAGVNFADTLRRAGKPYPSPTPLPFNPGCEFAGIVEKCGAGVDAAWIGQRAVVAHILGGGYADYACVPASLLLPVPEGLGAENAVALLIQGLTAALCLREGGLTPEKSVFIEAATGGVGSLAVQIARLFGAKKIIAGVGDDRKIEKAIELGADAAVNYSKPEWPSLVKSHTDGKGVDIVLDMTCGELLRRSRECLAPFGRLVLFGAAAPTDNAVDPVDIISQGQSMVGIFLGLYFQTRPQIPIALLHELASHVISGRLTPHIGVRLPLERAADAHRMMESRESSGKIILVP